MNDKLQYGPRARLRVRGASAVTRRSPSRPMSEAAAAEEPEQRPAVRALKRLLDAPLRVRLASPAASERADLCRHHAG
jgi:hypothetical protein